MTADWQRCARCGNRDARTAILRGAGAPTRFFGRCASCGAETAAHGPPTGSEGHDDLTYIARAYDDWTAGRFAEIEGGK